ncbi:MAG: hypothetical protein JWO52_7003 [Gammaproteobacteria bacterium]|nr:hypothetical protein [Gammaproteobacteria bacterium]
MRARRPLGGSEREVRNPFGGASSADYRPGAAQCVASNCIIFRKPGRLAIRVQ